MNTNHPMNIAHFPKRLLDMILPPRCIVTGDLVERMGILAPEAWQKLQFIQPPHCECCGIPFAVEMGDGLLCTDCLQNPPAFAKARAALVYDDESKKVILNFKYGDRTDFIPTLTNWLSQAGFEMLARTDFLVPIPLHPWRLWVRRYNQAALLAEGLAKATGLKTYPTLLKRVKKTKQHQGMSKAERYKNIANAFALSKRDEALVKGKTITLIDDVLTTGATVSEATRVLYKAGAQTIYVLTIARTLKNNDDFKLSKL
jgi:ComF family protein